MGKNIPIKVNNHVVGSVVGKLFIKRVNGSVHFLRVPPAIAFDKQSLKDAISAGATDTMVIDKETGIAYCSTIEHIYTEGFLLDRGYGEQIALSMDGWTKLLPASMPSQPALI